MEVFEKVSASLQEEFSGLCCSVSEELEPYCESPIEVMLGTAILVGWNLTSGLNAPPFVRFAPSLDDVIEDRAMFLVPQYVWEGFRIDFALIPGLQAVAPLFIECDGHDFHERTKEQAERDRSKDRTIQTSGISILRFTGREINRSPGGCASQVLTTLHKSFMRRRIHGQNPNNQA